jgi:hypothetical protein
MKTFLTLAVALVLGTVTTFGMLGCDKPKTEETKKVDTTKTTTTTTTEKSTEKTPEKPATPPEATKPATPPATSPATPAKEEPKK